MGLFDIAFKNIKRNFYNYFLYFVSMIFSIMIYFTFTSIQYNTKVQEAVGSSVNFAAVFKAAAIVVAVFVSIFIWYSNSFFIRKRKKEVALYSLLGIRKKEIGRMLFYENIVMGILALIAGILVGGLLSKLFIMLLIKLMGFSASISFMIPIKAVINTAIIFSILFLLTSINGYRLIYKFKLIELFKAENEGEREPKASLIRSALAIIFIAAGYLLYTKGPLTLSVFAIPVTLVLTVIGTFLLFSSLTLLVIKLSKKNKRRYYSGINMVGTSQLLYRIKGSARTLAIIAVLSAATLTAMEVSSSFYYDLTVNLQKNHAFTYAFASNNTSLDKNVEDIISKYPKNKILSSVDMNFAKVHGLWVDADQASNFYLISESNYNKVASARGLKDKVELNSNDEIIIYDENLSFTSPEKSYIGKTINIDTNNQKQTLKVKDYKDYSLVNTGMIRRVVVVKDQVYSKYYLKDNLYRIKGYITDNKKDSEELTKEFISLINNKLPKSDGSYFNYSAYYEDYRAGLTYSGLIIFIGAFLGLVFLVATGSIIFFKQLSEANDDKNRYEILKKIGVTSKEIKASISKQIFMIFALPLGVGIIHSLVASTLLSKITRMNLTLPIIITIGAYTIIYMIYYFLTVNSYYDIINSKRYA
ncbi:FtsX-like permease family protein [Clostridium paridis]|uniref:ABC transporter permease n=1 Tax=Clostridium paridis TaxID=2803863 RepID=A0A937FK73_9CLOT|nr:ABC transporter permease [Clostridium paridis]MBL4933231.1 ABC transporter permease [Clostridium paridis]